jgi:CheY-like chemotaxis protein
MAFDLIFTDIDTPGAFDGLELARRVAEEIPQARILIASGRRIPTARDMPQGACFLSKPYMFQQLELALDTLGLAD